MDNYQAHFLGYYGRVKWVFLHSNVINGRISESGLVFYNKLWYIYRSFFILNFLIIEIVSNHNRSNQISLLQTLRDPCSQNKQEIIEKIKSINQNLHRDGKDTYFCKQCNFIHKKGRIYDDHKRFGEIIFEFPDITPIKVERQILIKIVGIYGVSSESICEEIKRGERLRVKILKSGTIAIYYGRYKIGYVNQLQTDLVTEIIKNQNQDQDQDKNLETYYEFRYYYPAQYITKSKRISQYKHIYFKAPYGQMFLYSMDMKNLNKIIAGLIELHELGHPRVEFATIYFPIRAIRYFEDVAANSGYIDLVRKILRFKHNKSNRMKHGKLLF